MRATQRNESKAAVLDAQSKAAVAAIKQLLRDVPLDDSMSDSAMKAAQIGSRVPMEAFLVVALILEGSPGRFPMFDAKEARAVVDYIRAMAPVASALEVALGRVQKSVAKRRKAAADVTLALYGMLKGLDRIGLGGKEAAYLKQLQQLLTTYRQPRALKVTKKAIAVKKASLKATKVAAAARAKAEKANAKLDAARARAALDLASTSGSGEK